jgi:hypothetical protein
MKTISRLAAGLALLMLLWMLPKPGQITPNTIRIQSTETPGEGRWVVMPDFRELGSPCFSRDGEWIAFDAYKEGYNSSPSECWVARKDDRDLKRLAIGATPRWSPDGKRLLFMRDEANDPKHESGIFLIDRDGTGERRIGDGRWPDWSPDGEEIAFSLGGHPGLGLREGATICIAKADGTGLREIAQGDCPSWSPDGKKIAYCQKASDRSPLIFVHDLGTGKDEMLGIGWYRANWIPDSKSLVANGIIEGRECMVRFSSDAPGRPQESATEFARPSSPCCSWDGKQMIFIARRSKG